jgi:hypothetical protein
MSKNTHVQLEQDKEIDNTCHVCYEEVPEGKGVTCENGHTCCQKHHLERVRAIYQEGRSAFEGMGTKVENANGQDCFMCRCYLPDALFSLSYFKCLTVIQTIEIPKMHGLETTEHPIDSMRAMASLIQSRGDQYKVYGLCYPQEASVEGLG